MTKKQEKQLNEIIFSWHAEGQDITFIERENLVSIFEGKRSYKDIISKYIAEATANV